MENIEKRLFKLLRSLAIQPSYNGYEYIKEAVIMKMNATDEAELKIGQIYDTIAKKKNVTLNSVERAIKYAVRKSINNPNVKPVVSEIFGDLTTGTFTNHSFIFCICEYLKYNDDTEDTEDTKDTDREEW